MMLLFILLNLLMLFSSHLTAYRFSRAGSFSEHLVTAFLVYISQITLSLFFLGLAARNLGMTWIIFLNCAVSLFIIYRLRRTVRESFRSSYSKIRAFSKEITSAKDYFLYLFVFLFAVQVSALLIKIYYLPPHVWDVFAYHLHPVAEWFQQNFIAGAIDSPVARINRNPAGSRLFHFWSTVAVGDIRWIELPQFIFGLIVPLTSYSLMLKLRLKKNTALKYAILIYFIPSILIQSRTCQDHLVLTAAILMAALYFVTSFYEGQNHLVLLGMALGIMLGIKISSPLTVGFFFLALTIGKGFNWRRTAAYCRENRRAIWMGLAFMAALGGYWYCRNSLITNTYFYRFEYLFSSKVLFIMAAALCLFIVIIVILRIYKKKSAGLVPGRRSPADERKESDGKKNRRRLKISAVIAVLVVLGLGILSHAGLFKTVFMSYRDPSAQLTGREFFEQYPLLKIIPGDFLKNVLSFPFRIKDIGHYTPYTPDFLAKSGFGVQFFGFGAAAYLVVAFLLLVKRIGRKEIAGFLFIFSTVLLGSYFFYYYSEANYRMFMFFPVFGLMLWPLVVETLDFHRFYRGVLNVLILVMLLFNGVVCLFEGNLDYGRWKTLLTVDNPQQRTSIKFSPLIEREEWTFIDRYIPPEEPVAYLGHYDSWVFPYYDNQLKRRLFNLASMPGYRLKNGGEKTRLIVFNRKFKENLKKRGIHFIHVNPQGARHLKRRRKGIFIDDKSVFRISKYLYYFLW